MRSNSFRLEHAVTILFAAAAMIILMSGVILAAEAAAPTEKAAVEDTYPLDTCIVTGAKLGSMGEPVVYDHEGREIRFCCAGCIKKFEADPNGYLKKMDDAITAAETGDYPLETCVVTGKKLGSAGEPVDYIYDNHLVRFCCAGCIKAFEKDPARYAARIDEARARRAAEAPRPYPLDTCIVSGARLGSMGEPVTRVYKGQEVKFCCAGCLPRFESDPDKYLEKLHSAGSGPAEATMKKK